MPLLARNYLPAMSLLSSRNRSAPTGFIERYLPSPPGRQLGPTGFDEIKHDGYHLMARRDAVGILTRTGAMTPPQTASQPHVQGRKAPLSLRSEQASCSYSDQEQVPPVLCVAGIGGEVKRTAASAQSNDLRLGFFYELDLYFGAARRRNPMTRFVMLCLIALMTCALFGTKLFAQAGQTVTPPPQRAASH